MSGYRYGAGSSAEVRSIPAHTEGITPPARLPTNPASGQSAAWTEKR